jgi:hypothetical protein
MKKMPPRRSPGHERNYPTDSADILEAAAEVLETEGWCQEDYRKVNDNGGWSYCAVGALRKVVGYYDGQPWDMNFQRRAQAMREAQDMLGSGGTIYDFNDEPTTTADVIIDLMKHKAKDLRNRKEPA